jgi:hypothetical protein
MKKFIKLTLAKPEIGKTKHAPIVINTDHIVNFDIHKQGIEEPITYTRIYLTKSKMSPILVTESFEDVASMLNTEAKYEM